MELKDRKIAFCLTSSFYTFKNTIKQIKKIIEKGGKVIPIMSENSYNTDTKFGKAQNFIDEIETITDKKIIHTIYEAEQLGIKEITDILIAAPCNGNTIAKLAHGITDSLVTIAIKSHLRNSNPVVIGIDAIDGLSENAENIGKLLNRNNYFFVPFRQGNPITKPRSLSFDPEYIIKSLEYALDREQIQPILL